jgi:hypothetical protein
VGTGAPSRGATQAAGEEGLVVRLLESRVQWVQLDWIDYAHCMPRGQFRRFICHQIHVGSASSANRPPNLSLLTQQIQSQLYPRLRSPNLPLEMLLARFPKLPRPSPAEQRNSRASRHIACALHPFEGRRPQTSAASITPNPSANGAGQPWPLWQQRWPLLVRIRCLPCNSRGLHSACPSLQAARIYYYRGSYNRFRP